MKKEFVSYTILILLLILITASVVFGPKIETNTTSAVNNLPDQTSQIQNHTQSFSDIQNTSFNLPQSVENSFVGVSQVALINDDNTVITYNSKINPNIGNVIGDLLEGFSNVDQINIEGCINQDQIAVNYQTKTCTSEDCYDRFGNRVGINQTIEETVSRGNIDFCANQDLGYLTFNFAIDSLTNSIQEDVLFMEIETLYLGVSRYNQLRKDSELVYYFDNNLFVEDLNIDKDIIIPRIIHSRFKKNNFRQKLIIQRYSTSTDNPASTATTTVTNSNNSSPDISSSPLAELFFRPGQLFLTAVNVENSINSVIGNPDSSIFNPNYAVRIISQNGNKSAKCIIDSGSNIRVIDGGENYTTAGILIEADDGTFIGTFDITLSKKSKRLVMGLRNEVEDKQRSVWLLTAPQDLTPQGITKQNKITKGYIQNFSDQSPVSNIKKASSLPQYSNVSPGTIISPVQFDLVTTTIKDSLSANNCKYLYNDERKVVNSCSNVGNLNGQPLSFYSRFKNLFNGQIDTNQFLNFFEAPGGKTSSFSINPQAYSQYPPYLLKSVNKFPLFSDPKNLTNKGEVGVYVFEYNPTINQDNFQVFVGVSPNQDITIPKLSGDIILDGAAEWQEINTFSETVAFRKDYFTQPSLSDGTSTITRISNISINNPGTSFVQPLFGKVSQIDITSANYDNITLPNFDSNKIINLDSTTLTLESQGASIGQEARCLLSFVKEGTSIVIQTAQILNAGKDYNSGTFGILGSGLSVGLTGTIEGIEIASADDEYIFEAITTTTDNNSPISPSDVVNNLDFDINYGLVVNPVIDKVLDLQAPKIIEGGQNYNVGISVYINQYDITGESVFGVDYNPENITMALMKNLPSVIVNGVSSSNILEPSPFSLFSDTSIGISYNFWEDSPGTFENSPQQIIFYGDFINGTSPANVLGDPADGLPQFLLDNKNGDSAFTNVEYLQSLQIPSYYYQDSTLVSPVIEPYEGLTLKRFIPYSQFSPPEFNSGENIPTKKPSNTYINYNYCQFIPLGIENIYNKKIDSSNLASF